MQIPNGVYEATTNGMSVYESENGALVVATLFKLENGTEMVARTTIVNKDGQVNLISIGKLKAIYSWDGQDPFWLCKDENFNGKPASLTIEDEEYNGKINSKIKYIDPVGGTSRMPASADRNAILNKYGAKFRALAGGAPVAKPAAAPKAPAPMRKAAPSLPGMPPTSNGTTATPQSAWEVCCKECETTGADTNTVWFDVLGKLFPGRDTKTFTPQDWGRVVDELRGDAVPM